MCVFSSCVHRSWQTGTGPFLSRLLFAVLKIDGMEHLPLRAAILVSNVPSLGSGVGGRFNPDDFTGK